MKEIEIIQLPKITDSRGSLSFVEVGQILNFSVKRAYWIYDTSEKRGGHAHKQLKQLLFCPSGSVDVFFDNCTDTKHITLDKPNVGILVTGPVWREIEFRDTKSVLMVLASDIYNQNDYINSYEELRKWKSNF
jgi:dTDP-4-dehydrorhamnose 3,5-epimerase-like enzyme